MSLSVCSSITDIEYAVFRQFRFVGFDPSVLFNISLLVTDPRERNTSIVGFKRISLILIFVRLGHGTFL